MRAVRFHSPGGPDVLRLDEVEAPTPAAGEIRVAVAYAGVNFIDCYLRSGLYDPGPLPAGLGKEGAGVVEAVGEGVDGPAVGDRVAFCEARASYAELVTLPAMRAVPVPAAMSWEIAAALPLQGMTADYLVHDIGRVTAGDVVLIHAAAGGVGRLATQLAKRAGATVLGTCSTAAKAALARAAGCDQVILYTEVDFADAVLAATGGRGADLVLDSVGRATFAGSVRATRVRGTLVCYGQSSGPLEPFSPRPVLGSRTLVTATLFDYVRRRDELLARWQRVAALAAAGELEVVVDHVAPLAEAAAAHRRLESRASSGKLLLAVAEPPAAPPIR
ncbi:MAG: quinone oxidoreductase [Thermoanaerobaculia bacterium]|nr:quinone oxidoreductase [Thermoanaerobaculia bacterium]